MTPRWLAVLLVAGCGSGQVSGGEPASPPVVPPERPGDEPPVVPPQVVTAPPTPGSPPSPAPGLEEWQKQRPGAVWPPPGWVPPQCEVEVSTRAVRRGKAFGVTALASNRSGKPVTLSLPSRCPQGPVVFHGLGEGYDYYGSCTKGACAGPRDPERFTIPPGQSVQLAAVEIDPNGGGCTEALPAGRHTVSFSVPFSGQVCAGTFATVDGRAAPKETQPAKPAPRAPCPPMPACGIACPGGEYARDSNGCTTCGCVDRRGVLPP